jgi:hypothetical protein
MPYAWEEPEPTMVASPITFPEIVPLKVAVPLPLLTWIAPPCLLPLMVLLRML